MLQLHMFFALVVQAGILFLYIALCGIRLIHQCIAEVLYPSQAVPRELLKYSLPC